MEVNTLVKKGIQSTMIFLKKLRIYKNQNNFSLPIILFYGCRGEFV